jgi:hypothetical protein
MAFIRRRVSNSALPVRSGVAPPTCRVAALGHDRHAMPGAKLDQGRHLVRIGGRRHGQRAAGEAPAPVGQPPVHGLLIGGDALGAEQGGCFFKKGGRRKGCGHPAALAARGVLQFKSACHPVRQSG